MIFTIELKDKFNPAQTSVIRINADTKHDAIKKIVSTCPQFIDIYSYNFLSSEYCPVLKKYDIISDMTTKDEEMVFMTDRIDIYNYLDWRDYDKNIQYLANMAIAENWNYPGKNENYILKNYLRETFWRLQDENKIIETDKYILFNTGLFTDLYESIYVYGEKHGSKQPNGPQWFFKSFCTEYDLGDKGISDFPKRANYFSDPSLLIFDPNLDINVHLRHILKDADNIDRIKELQSKNIRSLIIGEIDKVKKRVAANYKIAVPQYYQGGIQLLLPLCLEDGETPFVALTVERKDGYYQASTCLTLDMAYNNARLIAKPESNWLSNK